MTSVLFVRLSAMGDLVQGLGAVQALHAARPDWRLTVVTQAPWAPLLEGLPGVVRVVAFARRGGLAAVLRLRRELRADRYDVALDLQGNWKSAFVAWLSGAAQRVGCAARQEPASRWLLHRLVPCASRHPAVVAAALGRDLAPALPFQAPVLQPRAAEIERERAELRALGVAPERAFRVLVVTDPRDPRALRPGVLAAEAAGSVEPVVWLLGPAEAELRVPEGARVLRHGPGEVRRLVALGHLVAQAGGVVLGPDQGGSHVLAAAGARCIVSFGAQDPERTAPPTATIVRHAAPPACSPCRRRVCGHPAGPVCMDFTHAAGREQGRLVDRRSQP